MSSPHVCFASTVVTWACSALLEPTPKILPTCREGREYRGGSRINKSQIGVQTIRLCIICYCLSSSDHHIHVRRSDVLSFLQNRISKKCADRKRKDPWVVIYIIRKYKVRACLNEEVYVGECAHGLCFVSRVEPTGARSTEFTVCAVRRRMSPTLLEILCAEVGGRATELTS